MSTQPIWAMEQLPWKRPTPWTLEEQIDRIVDAGFDGISVSFADAERAKQICALATERDLRIRAAYFPTSVEDLKRVFETIARSVARTSTTSTCSPTSARSRWPNASPIGWAGRHWPTRRA